MAAIRWRLPRYSLEYCGAALFHAVTNGPGRRVKLQFFLMNIENPIGKHTHIQPHFLLVNSAIYIYFRVSRMILCNINIHIYYIHIYSVSTLVASTRGQAWEKSKFSFLFTRRLSIFIVCAKFECMHILSEKEREEERRQEMRQIKVYSQTRCAHGPIVDVYCIYVCVYYL